MARKRRIRQGDHTLILRRVPGKPNAFDMAKADGSFIRLRRVAAGAAPRDVQATDEWVAIRDEFFPTAVERVVIR